MKIVPNFALCFNKKLAFQGSWAVIERGQPKDNLKYLKDAFEVHDARIKALPEHVKLSATPASCTIRVSRKIKPTDKNPFDIEHYLLLSDVESSTQQTAYNYVERVLNLLDKPATEARLSKL